MGGSTYEDFKDVDLVDEGGVIFDLLFLDGLDRELLVTFAVLRQVHDAEPSISKLLLERVDFLDVALSRVNEVLLVVRCIIGTGCTSTACTCRIHCSHYLIS